MIGIYTRLSVEDEESNSIENQLREGKVFANNRPFELYNEGMGVSGRSKTQVEKAVLQMYDERQGVSDKDDMKDRPELDRLLKDIATGKITTVWMRNQNRLERNSFTFFIFFTFIEKHKTRVVFGDKEMDWNDPSNFLQSSILTAINSYQARIQSYQTKKALKDNVKQGKAHSVTAYGYTTDDKGYMIIDPEEAEVVKRIYDLSLSGKGQRTIAELLNDEGVPTRYNKLKGTLSTPNKYTGEITTTSKKDIKWSGATVRGIVINTIYKGERNWSGKVYKSPQIIDPLYWQKVNDNLKNNSNNTGKKTEHKYLLKGFLECGCCGRNYYGRTRLHLRDNYYMCSSKRIKTDRCKNRSINIGVLDSLIWESMFKNDSLYNKMVTFFQEGGTAQRREELDKLIQKHEAELSKLATKEKRRVELLLEGDISKEQSRTLQTSIIRETNDLEERLQVDREELFELQNETRILDDIQADFGFISVPDMALMTLPHNKAMKQEIGDRIIKKKRLKTFDPSFNEKKRILSKYVKRIIIDWDVIEKVYYITIKYNLQLEDDMYITDSFYIAALDVSTQKIMDWHFDYGRTFTDKKVSDTKDHLLGRSKKVPLYQNWEPTHINLY